MGSHYKRTSTQATPPNSDKLCFSLPFAWGGIWDLIISFLPYFLVSCPTLHQRVGFFGFFSLSEFEFPHTTATGNICWKTFVCFGHTFARLSLSPSFNTRSDNKWNRTSLEPASHLAADDGWKSSLKFISHLHLSPLCICLRLHGDSSR